MYFDIDNLAIENTKYRDVIYTIPNFQLVLMSIPKGKDIPEETHKNVTQFIKIVKGLAIAKVSDREYGLGEGSSITIPPGTKHRIINMGKSPLKLYTIYTPPEH